MPNTRFFHQLVEHANLGVLKQATLVPGGRIHTVWKLETNKGNFAVKILNPERSSHEELIRYRQTEAIAKQLPHAVSALLINHDVIYRKDSHYCMVYPWIEGKTPENDRMYAYKIGKILAQIHNRIVPYNPLIPSHTTYVNQRQNQQQDWSCFHITGELKDALIASLSIITAIQVKALELQTQPLSDQQDCVVSHRDLDSTNVILTPQNELKLIDWELAGYIEPCTDFLLTGIYTARTAPGEFDLDLFKDYIAGYLVLKPIPKPLLWEKALFRILDGWLQWLHFNLQRTKVEGDIGYIEAQKILKSIVAVYSIKEQWNLNRYVQTRPLRYIPEKDLTQRRMEVLAHNKVKTSRL